ncbi:MAG: hypothetical protein WBA41_27010, partial [Rivularia sp. (in: cyanobacteria)]
GIVGGWGRGDKGMGREGEGVEGVDGGEGVEVLTPNYQFPMPIHRRWEVAQFPIPNSILDKLSDFAYNLSRNAGGNKGWTIIIKLI